MRRVSPCERSSRVVRVVYHLLEKSCLRGYLLPACAWRIYLLLALRHGLIRHRIRIVLGSLLLLEICLILHRLLFWGHAVGVGWHAGVTRRGHSTSSGSGGMLVVWGVNSRLDTLVAVGIGRLWRVETCLLSSQSLS